MFSRKFFKSVVFRPGVIFVLAMCLGLSGSIAMAGSGCPDDDEFTTEFYLQDCGGFSNTGTNPFFTLEVGYKLILEGEEENDEGGADTIRAEITVLDETEEIYLGIAEDPVVARVVEEREYVNDVLIEVSRNFFAICNRTNSVFYGGEDVFECESGLVQSEDGFICRDEEEEVSNEGAWRAGEHNAKPGLIMPGTFLLGSKYFQERARDAVDRGENVAMGLKVKTPAGMFHNCVEVVDTNPAEGVCGIEDGDVKIYCPGIGLVMDEDLELIEIIGDFYPPSS